MAKCWKKSSLLVKLSPELSEIWLLICIKKTPNLDAVYLGIGSSSSTSLKIADLDSLHF